MPASPRKSTSTLPRIKKKKRKLQWSKIYSFACGVGSSFEDLEEGGFTRIVHCNRRGLEEPYPDYCSNYVSTTKYNAFTFIPKALFEQFRRVANVYFLFCAILSLTPLTPFSATSIIAPLAFVIGVSMTKEAIEDWQRFTQDKEINKRKIKLHAGSGIFEDCEWQNLKVGQVVKVDKDNFFPADLLLVSSSYDDGVCYVETMNLDGETNLKLKKSLLCTSHLQSETMFAPFDAVVKCEDPNPNLYTFVGALDFAEILHSIEPQQILLRGSKLRNTDFIYGVIIFSGHDTKVMQNSTSPPSKRSFIEHRMDKLIYFLFTVLIIISTIGSIVFGLRIKNETPNWWYLQPQKMDYFFNPSNPVLSSFLHLITAMILYGYLIPISLYVSIEIVKFLQAIFINQDFKLYNADTDKPAKARTSNLNEELGQVDTILSDKTGTLTCNMMEFCKCTIAGTSYGEGVTRVEKVAAERLRMGSVEGGEDALCLEEKMDDTEMTKFTHVKNFNFKDDRITNGNWVNLDTASSIQLFFRILAVCHTAIPEEDEETRAVIYEAESPDEACFVIAAREFGFEFHHRTQSTVMVREFDPISAQTVDRWLARVMCVHELAYSSPRFFLKLNGSSLAKSCRKYQILELLEFTSSRKRMTVFTQDEEGQIFLFSKGADSTMLKRLAEHGRACEEATREHLEKYAEAGLRTLVITYRKLSMEEFLDWHTEFVKAKTYVGADRDSRLEEVAELIERDLVLIGATAVEDKLQKGVPECIDKLAKAGIKIWVLTGDKLETAVNIGFACSLLRQGMKQLVITLDRNEVMRAESSGNKDHYVKVCRECVQTQIEDGKRELEGVADGQMVYALIIDGAALIYALDENMKGHLLSLAVKCASVICCRVSPKQKALVTNLVKEGTGKITLGIGDGANDVGMIQAADIGVGISGVEGMQATMASDFSIAQFRFLERLLLVHGSWCYKRISLMICYFFYKNINFGCTLFYYEAYTAFSGQPAYNDWYMSLFNVCFTSLPVLALGVLEQDLSDALKLEFPALYQQGVQNKLFSWQHIMGWMCNGVCCSLVIFYLVTNILNFQAFRKDGKVPGMGVVGATMYTCVIITVNCQIALAIKYFTWVQHFFIWGSIFSWYVFLSLYGSITPIISQNAYQVFFEALAPSPIYWITVLLVVFAAIFPYFTLTNFQSRVFPMDHQIIQEVVYYGRDRDSDNRLKKANTAQRSSIGFSASVEEKMEQMNKKTRSSALHSPSCSNYVRPFDSVL